MSLSLVILTHTQIPLQLDKSTKFADEVLIVHDQDSSRLSLPKSTSLKNLKILARPLKGNFAAQRNFALQHAQADWVLFIDSDELVTPQLAGEITKAVKTNHYQGYYLKRQDVFYHQPLNHGEAGQIALLRLARKNAGKFKRPVHETWQITGPTKTLNYPLLHFHSNLTTSFISKIALYSPLDAQALLQEKKPFSFFRLLFNPIAKFFLNFILKLGFLDRTLGLFHAYLISLQSLTVRIFQWSAKNP